MDYKLYTKTVNGRRHASLEKANEDHVQHLETDKVICISVSDGCSGCDFPSQSAMINGKVAELVASNRTLWTYGEKEFKRQLARIYAEQFALTGYPYDELCATTAFVIIDKKSGDYIAFSVGDSAILCFDEELEFRQLLKPVNGTRKTQTVFTNDQGAVARSSNYRKGRISIGVAGFLLYTDGAENLAAPPYMDAQQLVSAMLLSEETVDHCAESTIEQLAALNADDISFAMVAKVNAKTTRVAQATYNGKTEPTPPIEPPKQESAAEDPAKTKVAPSPFRAQQAKVPEPPVAETTPSTFLNFLDEPRTAQELLHANVGLSQENLIDTMMSFLRVNMITVRMDKIGHLLFQRKQ